MLWKECQGCRWTVFSTEGIRCVTHGSRQPSQQNTGMEIGSSRKDLWRTLFFNGMNIQETYKVFENIISAATMPVSLKGTETG